LHEPTNFLGQALLGLLPEGLSVQGQIESDGRTVERSDRAGLQRYWANHLTLVPQEPRAALDPTMRVLPQIAGTAPQTHAHQTMTSLSLHDSVGRQYPFMLSGGMAQRVLVPRALTTQAPVLIAGEPTKGLDDDRVEETVSRFRHLLDHGRAVLAITHDIRVARGLGGEIGVMRAGRILEQGPLGEVRVQRGGNRRSPERECAAESPASRPARSRQPASRGYARKVFELTGTKAASEHNCPDAHPRVHVLLKRSSI
jgi:peptide/nickel transport system ATP-binding protein